MKKLVLASAIGMSFIASTVLAGEMISTEKEFFAKGGAVVTAENYAAAESARQFLKNQDLAGVNKFLHKRELTPTDNQPVVRMNRDTYYSFAIIDVSKGAYIEMPDIPKGKYMSIQPVTEDHRIQAMRYGSGKFDLTTHIGTHVYVVVRLDSTFTQEEASKIQDQMKIVAKSDNKYQSGQFDKASFEKVEMDLKTQMLKILKRDGAEALYGMFTDPKDASKELYTQEKYAVGAAIGWGGAQLADNVYEVSGNYPADMCHQATFEDPKNNAFWSITVYDKKGFMFNDLANLSSNTAKPNPDGTYTISFGCGDKAINNIPTKNASGVFNLGIRHYMPSDRVKNDGYRLLPFVKAK
ncbi:DUF1254 domain-containing protein [Thalassotalea euphylliae]|uniref:DUF1254 domain-containing protein n=1 Tax=Thalassotalea euphylliae TaxID=1655234 RepID=UPI003642E701